MAYVGSYTPNGPGIALFRVDPSTGALVPIKTVAAEDPSFLAFDPQKTHLYAVNEISNFNGGTTGSVSAYAIDQSTGDLTLLNSVSSAGADPAHLSVDPSGRYVLVANYGGANVATFPILPGGGLGGARDIKNDVDACTPKCAVGPTKATSAPPGSFAIGGHDAPHPAMIEADKAGRHVIVNDIGLDLTIVWDFDPSTGLLSNPRTTPSSPGAGPRHFAFNSSGSRLYSVNEEASTIAVMAYEASSGTLTPLQEISTLPPAFVGTSFGSEVIVSPDGRLVYAANRMHDSVMTFAVLADGRLAQVGDRWTRGSYPRHINVHPSGRFLYAGNQRGDSVTSIRLSAPGAEHDTFLSGTYTAVGSPACIVFLSLP